MICDEDELSHEENFLWIFLITVLYAFGRDGIKTQPPADRAVAIVWNNNNHLEPDGTATPVNRRLSFEVAPWLCKSSCDNAIHHRSMNQKIIQTAKARRCDIVVT